MSNFFAVCTRFCPNALKCSLYIVCGLVPLRPDGTGGSRRSPRPFAVFGEGRGGAGQLAGIR